MGNVDVSILCTAFNHEKYIKRCLEGFLMQRGVSYEILIHDDASTDDTASIIFDFQRNYPEIVKPIFQTENQYSQKIPIVKKYLIPKISGRYVAICEGDDYWSDPDKLAKQVRALDENLSCSICVHRVTGVNEFEVPNERLYPRNQMNSGSIPSDQIMKMLYQYPFHTSSFFVRADEYVNYQTNKPLFAANCDVGDEPFLLYMALKGAFYYISDSMSCYRLNDTSVTAKWRKDDYAKQYHLKRTIVMLEEFNKYSDYLYNECAIEARINEIKAQVYYREKDYKRAYYFAKCNHQLIEKKQYYVYCFSRYIPLFAKLYSIYRNKKDGKQS